MPRRIGARVVKKHRSYTVAEAARLLKVCRATVRRWTRSGLRVLNDQKPALIMGAELIAFLERRKKPKRKTRLDECYCFTCQDVRKMAFGEAEVSSSSANSTNLRALCETCAGLMFKRVSKSQLVELGRMISIRNKGAINSPEQGGGEVQSLQRFKSIPVPRTTDHKFPHSEKPHQRQRSINEA